MVETYNACNGGCLLDSYHQIIKNNDAKYKIYLDSNVFIINKNFLSDIIEIFKNKKIGMIGITGEIISLQYPWQAKVKYGSIYSNNMGIMEHNVFKNELGGEGYHKVDLIDKYMMITQYDLPWRQDLRIENQNYYVSQCMEFLANDFWL